MAVKPPRTAAAGHTAGIFADMTLDGPEIGTLVAVIDRAKNLPNRKTMGKQDPYCAMRLGKEAKKTETDRRGGQTPKWDQELRFTVHESPDYYRLKCSIFNDDKRTDLIGEAWIDLSDLIKPGGGSNDLWHQLNYKGKYAGEVRIELTYYDLRPREEKTTEKRKLRDKVSSASGDSINTTAPRQLGPREVRRRPLPTSPAATSPAQTPPASTPQEQPPAPPPKIPIDHLENQHFTPEPQHRHEDFNSYNPYADDFVIPQSQPQPQLQQQVQHYRQPFCEDQTSTTEYEEEPRWDVPSEQPSPVDYTNSHSLELYTSGPQTSSWPSEQDVWHQTRHSMSQQRSRSDAEYTASPHSLPSPPVHNSESPSHSPRSNPSPTKSIPYRDSPLRQSISQQDVYGGMVEEPDAYDLPLPQPPPPPMHRETTPRRQPSEFPPSSFTQYEQTLVPFAPRPLHVTPRRRSVDERSPLQHIEHEYEMYSDRPRPSQESFERRGSHDQYQADYDRRPPATSHYSAPERQSTYDQFRTQDYPVHHNSGPYDHERSQRAASNEPVYQKPSYQERASSYDDRRLSRNPHSMDDYQVAVPHSFSQPDLPMEDRHVPQQSRSRPTNSNSNSRQIQRKAVSPGPYPEFDDRRMSAVPYGPDAYDVLNPASSPVTNEGTPFQTRDQARESARMKEVSKLRDQGPIIGNDGRVIDPSDHLPSDTWAPEPERKTRKPEHVIHYRTKKDTRPHTTPNSSPASARASRPRTALNQGGPVPSPGPASSPSSGKNRLQKTSPTRPLPVQPYQRVSQEPPPRPYVETGPVAEPLSNRGMQRRSHQDLSPVVQRPHLSEYQVPASNNYVPRGVSFADQPSIIPPKAQMQTGRAYNSHQPHFYDDPLAAEMSMIDIGPSKGGQMVLSGRRNY